MRSVLRLLTVVLVCGWTFAAGRTGFVRTVKAQRPASAASEPAFSPQPILNKYCVGCHNQNLRTAGLALDILSESDFAAHAETWENVVRKLRAGAMPPPGAPR